MQVAASHIGSTWLSSNQSPASTVRLGVDRYSNNLYTFLAAAHYYEVDYLPFSWEPRTKESARGGTSRLIELDVGSSFPFNGFIFKCTRANGTRGYNQQNPWDDSATFNALVAEITVLCHPVLKHHENIVQLEGIGWDVSPGGIPAWPVIALEKAELGDLHRFRATERGRQLTMSEKLYIGANVAGAILALHQWSKALSARHALKLLIL